MKNSVESHCSYIFECLQDQNRGFLNHHIKNRIFRASTPIFGVTEKGKGAEVEEVG